MSAADQVTLLTKWKFLQRLFADRRLNEADLRVAGVLADYFNVRKSKAWPSLSHLAKRTNQSQSTIQRSLARLEKNGIVIKRSGGKGRANEYDLTFADPDPGHSSDYSHSSDQGDRSQLRPGGMVTALTTHTSYSPEHQAKGSVRGIPASRGAAPLEVAARASGAGDRSQEQPGDTTGSGDTTGNGFEQFWQAYPKKEGRAAAKKQFAEVVGNGVALATLVAKAKQYAMAKAEVDPKWLKTPANWLRDEGWLEDPQPPRRPKTKATDPGKANRKAAGVVSDKAKAKTKAAAQNQRDWFRVGGRIRNIDDEDDDRTLGIILEIVDQKARATWKFPDDDNYDENDGPADLSDIWYERKDLAPFDVIPWDESIADNVVAFPQPRAPLDPAFKIGAVVQHKHGYSPNVRGRITMMFEDYPFDVMVEWRDEETGETGVYRQARDTLVVLPDAIEDSPFKVGALVQPKNDETRRAKVVRAYDDGKVDLMWRETGQIETLSHPEDTLVKIA